MVMKFGWYLKQARKEVNLSQERMAELLCMSRTSLSNLERDKAELKAETLLLFAKVIAKLRNGQAQSLNELAAITVCSVDVASVMQAIMQVMGGIVFWL